MALNIAIDELRATGWTDLDSVGCAHDVDGRAYPTVERVAREFAAAGCTLGVRHVLLFDCYRAEWSDATGRPLGAVVGSTQAEAAVFALTHLRRQMAAGATAN